MIAYTFGVTIGYYEYLEAISRETREKYLKKMWAWEAGLEDYYKAIGRPYTINGVPFLPELRNPLD